MVDERPTPRGEGAAEADVERSTNVSAFEVSLVACVQQLRAVFDELEQRGERQRL